MPYIMYLYMYNIGSNILYPIHFLSHLDLPITGLRVPHVHLYFVVGSNYKFNYELTLPVT